MTVTLTPEPSTGPSDAPRVRVEAVAPDGGTFTQLLLRRDGVDVRRQPFVGASETLAFDYEAPFGRSLSYQLTGYYLPVAAPDWSEAWASLASWSGDTADWSVAAGVASSSVNGADITRTASGTIQRVSVANPDYVRVELLTAGDVVVCSVAVTTSVTLTGTTATSTPGGGSFEMTLADATVTAAAADSSWSVSREYVGTPTKVRVVSLYPGYVQTATWSTTGYSYGPALDSAGNTYVADTNAKVVRKFNTSGVEVVSGGFPISLTASPRAIAVDSSGFIYVSDNGKSIRKFNTSGVQTLSFTGSAGYCYGLAVDSSGFIYVSDNGPDQVRKFNTSGVEVVSGGFPISTTGQPQGLVVDSLGAIYVGDATNSLIRKFNTSGVQTLSFSTTEPCTGVAIGTGGNIFAVTTTGFDAGRVRKFNTSGVQTLSFTGTGYQGIAVGASDTVYTGDNSNSSVRKFVLKANASTDDIVTTLVATEQSYSASATTQLDETRAWLIHPSQPTLSVAIDENQWSDTCVNVSLESAQATTHEQPTSIFSPPGRTRSVTYPLGPRRVGLWTLVLQMAALEARNAVLAALADGAPLLLRSPDSFDWDLPDDWYAVGDVTQARIVRPLKQPYRTLTLPLTPVDSPPVALVPEFTYGDVLINAPTYNDVLANYDTYLDVLTGTAS